MLESKQKIEIKEEIVLKIAKYADELGYKIYSVGGYVRDYFLNRERTDFDFTIEGDALEFAEKLSEKLNVFPVLYPRFRTALVPYMDFKLEFVGTRKEEYQEGSRNPIVVEGTLIDDLKRRDFTVNALAVSLNKDTFGEVYDLFNGFEDLDKKLLKTPLDPDITFSDDPLRMMRAVRFASQLGFEIDPSALESISRNSERIKIITQERISEEFLKILKSNKPGIGLKYIFDLGLMKIIFPEVYNLAGVDIVQTLGRTHQHKDVFIHTLKVLDNVAALSDNVWLRLAALLHDVAKPRTKRFTEGIGWSFHGHEEIGARWVNKIFKRMKLPFEHIDYVEKLVRLHQRPMVLVNEEVSDSAVRRLAFQAGYALEDLFLLCKCDITTNNPKLSTKYFDNYERVARKVLDVQEKDKLREFQSPVDGIKIMEICQLPPSRAIGIIKTNIEEAILDGLIPNEYEPAYEYFLNNKDIWLNDIANMDLSKKKNKPV
jgi:putative nucleotidyltransferase with HDIG domain